MDNNHDYKHKNNGWDSSNGIFLHWFTRKCTLQTSVTFVLSEDSCIDMSAHLCVFVCMNVYDDKSIVNSIVHFTLELSELFTHIGSVPLSL